jgi:hypothetical protein
VARKYSTAVIRWKKFIFSGLRILLHWRVLRSYYESLFKCETRVIICLNFIQLPLNPLIFACSALDCRNASSQLPTYVDVDLRYVCRYFSSDRQLERLRDTCHAWDLSFTSHKMFYFLTAELRNYRIDWKSVKIMSNLFFNLHFTVIDIISQFCLFVRDGKMDFFS